MPVVLCTADFIDNLLSNDTDMTRHTMRRYSYFTCAEILTGANTVFRTETTN